VREDVSDGEFSEGSEGMDEGMDTEDEDEDEGLSGEEDEEGSEDEEEWGGVEDSDTEGEADTESKPVEQPTTTPAPGSFPAQFLFLIQA